MTFFDSVPFCGALEVSVPFLGALDAGVVDVGMLKVGVRFGLPLFVHMLRAEL